MCARIFYLILAAMFVFVVVTIAAFQYLEWWQAILASLGTLLLMVFAAKVLIRVFVGQLGEFALGMVRVKSAVLKNAKADVHSVKQVQPPQHLIDTALDPELHSEDQQDMVQELQELRWYQIDATILPDSASEGPMKMWDLYDLCLVPYELEVNGAEWGSMSEGEDFHPDDWEIYHNGDFVAAQEGKYHGPQRIRCVVGVPPAYSLLKFRYYLEAFGRIELPTTLQLPNRSPKKRDS